MSDKIRFPHAMAIEVAGEIVTALTPFCERIMICGSLRRLKPEVGDIEICFVPQLGIDMDLLGKALVYNLADNRISKMVRCGIIKPRHNLRGSETWGPKNKLAIHVASGIPVDFFATTEESWWMTVVIRTGPKESNLKLIERASRRGLKLHAYGVYTRIPGGEKVIPESEDEVFELAGMSYEEPQDL